MLPYRALYEPRQFYRAHYIILSICLGVFAWELSATGADIHYYAYSADKPWPGVITAMFMHADPGHLIGNMVALFVFGKPLLDKLGTKRYLILFVLLGICAHIFYGLFQNGAVIGASGAISGIIGMSFVIMPFIDIKTAFWLIPPIVFDISIFWIAGYWFVMDIFYLSLGSQDRVAYHAHVGGFMAGVLVAIILLRTGKIVYRSNERSLLELFLGIKDTTFEKPKPFGRTCPGCALTLAIDAKRCLSCGATTVRIPRPA